MILGCHVNFKKDDQLLGCLKQALSYGANTFMFYTGAPQNTKRYAIEDGLTLEAMQLMKNEHIDYSKVVVHAPYIINLANDGEPDKYKFSVNFLQEEIERCKLLGITKLVLHPGSHVGLGVERAIQNISNAINMINNDSVVILLETMAGKGTEIGSKLEEIKEIIDRVENKDLVGVCLDTCHLSDAGYDIVHFDDFLDKFDEIIGLDKVLCVHVNDSKNDVGAHKDRHDNFGFGHIGFEVLMNVINNERLINVPKILETPYVGEYAPYKYEIAMITSGKFDDKLIEKIEQQA